MWYGRAGACVRGRRTILLCSAVVRPQPKGEDGCNNDGAGWWGGGIGGDEGYRRWQGGGGSRERSVHGACATAAAAMRCFRFGVRVLFIYFFSSSSTAKRPTVHL